MTEKRTSKRAAVRQRSKNAKEKRGQGTNLGVLRGSLVSLKHPPAGASSLAIVVSNDVQNDSSPYLLIVPLQKRASRLKAPFAVDLGKQEGLKQLHAARCDWLTRVNNTEVKQINRARFSTGILDQLDAALCAALGILPGSEPVALRF
jgi:hypothetical protein